MIAIRTAASAWTLAFVMLLPAICLAADDLAGWEDGSEYNKLYTPDEREDFKAKIHRVIEVTPMEGMAPGVGLIVIEKGTDEQIEVQMGPESYVKPKISIFKPGDMVKVYGVWSELDGKDVFLCNKVKRLSDEKQVKVRRTRDGKAWWNMTPEELAKEE